MSWQFKSLSHSVYECKYMGYLEGKLATQLFAR